ncbi:MAG: DUF992 domain-containing protein [Hyphomicrobium sp.]
MRWAMAITAAGLSCVLATPVAAAMQTDIGMLTCTLAEEAEKDTNPDSQSKVMHCAFKPKGTGPEETYIGEIKKVGTQSELSGKRVLIWAVMGPADRKLKPRCWSSRMWAKSRPRRQTSRSRRSCWSGESDKAYGLQPITDDAHDANASRSVTVVELRLKSTPT